jgi:hypothetical protein
MLGKGGTTGSEGGSLMSVRLGGSASVGGGGAVVWAKTENGKCTIVKVWEPTKKTTTPSVNDKKDKLTLDITHPPFRYEELLDLLGGGTIDEPLQKAEPRKRRNYTSRRGVGSEYISGLGTDLGAAHEPAG